MVTISKSDELEDRVVRGRDRAGRKRGEEWVKRGERERREVRERVGRMVLGEGRKRGTNEL